jgi:5-methylcytosine-specific restriction endonuclease McrA
MMVTKLNTPAYNYQQFINDVVAERQQGENKDFFNTIQSDWGTKCNDYIQNNGNPEIVQAWPAVTQNKKSLKNLYSNADKDSCHGKIIDGLRDRELQFCPACGEDGTPNTLDHYLPKDKYPEYSILPHNLFPMCDICQGEKLVKTLSAQGKRLFLHPYFDQFLTTQAVVLKIGQPYNSPLSIYLFPNPALTPSEQATVKLHLKELGIFGRYYKFFSSEYIRLLKLVTQLRNTGQDVKQNLVNFKLNASLKAPASWPHIFYSSVTNDTDLMNHLEHGNLPTYL